MDLFLKKFFFLFTFSILSYKGLREQKNGMLNLKF